MCRRRKCPDFVRDHAGQLRLVPHAQQQPGEDHRKARREHHRVEIGDVRQIDAHVLRGGPANAADDVLKVGDELRILDQQVRARDFLLGPVHQLPDALLVGLRRPISGPDQRHHVRGPRPGLCDPRSGGGYHRAAANEQRAATDLSTDACTSAVPLRLRLRLADLAAGLHAPDEAVDHLSRALRRADVAELHARKLASRLKNVEPDDLARSSGRRAKRRRTGCFLRSVRRSR